MEGEGIVSDNVCPGEIGADARCCDASGHGCGWQLFLPVPQLQTPYPNDSALRSIEALDYHTEGLFLHFLTDQLAGSSETTLVVQTLALISLLFNLTWVVRGTGGWWMGGWSPSQACRHARVTQAWHREET